MSAFKKNLLTLMIPKNKQYVMIRVENTLNSKTQNKSKALKRFHEFKTF